MVTPLSQRGFQRFAAPQTFAETAVARAGRRAGSHQIAHSGQAGQRGTFGADRDAQPHDLGQTASDDRRRGVFAQAYPGRHPASQRDDVLARAADLGADDIGIGVGPEVSGIQHALHGNCASGIAAGDDGGSGLPGSDLAGEVRTGDHRGLRRIDTRHVHDDLTHPHQSVQLDALGRADQGGAPGDQARPLLKVGPHSLRRHGQQHRGRPVQSLGRISGGPDAGRQLHARQVAGVIPIGIDVVGDVGTPRPERHLAAGVG